jgi:hypothetical protein
LPHAARSTRTLDRMSENIVVWLAPSIATLLGVLGALGLSLIPVRAWTLLVKRRIWEPVSRQPAQLVLGALALAGVVVAAAAAYDVLPRVHNCLMESRCGANKSSGMIALAILGIAVAVQELVWFLTGFGQRLVKRHAI